MDIRALAYAVTLAEELHFGRAARRHCISEQPFGKRIQQLERELGVRLFDRTSRRVSLTPAGAAVLAEVRTILQAVDQLPVHGRSAAAGPSTVRLGVLGFGAAHLWPAMRESFLGSSAGATVDFVDLDLTNQHDHVRHGLVDAAIAQELGDVPGLRFDPLFASPRVVAVPHDSALARRTSLRDEDLRDEDWLGVPSGPADLAAWIGPLAPTLLSGPQVTDPRLIPAAAATTGRLALHAALAVRYFPQPGVVFVPLESPPLRIALVTRATDDQPLIAALRASVAAVTPHGPQLVA